VVVAEQAATMLVLQAIQGMLAKLSQAMSLLHQEIL
jgi:hypothetical protein